MGSLGIADINENGKYMKEITLNLRCNNGPFFRFSIRYLLFSAITILLVSITMNPPLSHSETKKVPKYVGSDACKDCHKNEYDYFINYARKSKSFESVERLKRMFTEEDIKMCYPCHTTGYGKSGGFISPEKTPHLKNAGCEVCHGPGEFHVKTGGGSAYIKRRMAINDCKVCHTPDRVRAFRYRPLIHGGGH